MARKMRQVGVTVPGFAGPVPTSFVGPEGPGSGGASGTPFLLLHGFDSSCLEFRRLYPILSRDADAWAVDMLGWGFTDGGPGEYSPETKRAHLYSFWRENIAVPVVLVGASVGGAAAIDFAASHPEAVERIVLVDAQGYVDGLGPMSLMPTPVAKAGANVLRSRLLRRLANKMAYADKERFPTEDAMRVGRLHCETDGWLDNTVRWMQSGGYSVSPLIPTLQMPALVLWGRQDEILETSYAERFIGDLQDAKLVWVEECGHVAHLEQPEFMCEQLLSFRGAQD